MLVIEGATCFNQHWAGKVDSNPRLEGTIWTCKCTFKQTNPNFTYLDA
jgi:hypothetical protein